MNRAPADVQLAYDALASAAADPAIPDFDLADFERIQLWADAAEQRWLIAAARFFEFRRQRGEGNAESIAQFLRELGC